MEKDKLESIVGKCKQNDRASQEVLYRHYFPMMYRTVRTMTQDEDDLVSIVNDGFLKVFKYIRSYNAQLGVFEAWLHTVIVNTAYDHFKKRKDKNLAFFEMRVLEELPDNSHLFVTGHNEIQQLLVMLPATTQKVLSMSVDGYSHKEIAGCLRISEISSRWHLSEARKRVKDILYSKKKLYE